MIVIPEQLVVTKVSAHVIEVDTVRPLDTKERIPLSPSPREKGSQRSGKGR